MRLSTKAKELLDKREISELQALPFGELISPSDYQQYESYCKNPISAIPPEHSVSPDLTDPLFLSSLVDAAVVASGQIYSQVSIEQLRPQEGKLLCPLNRSVLTPCNGEEIFVRLPQVDVAVNWFRQLKSEAVNPSHFNLFLKVSSSKLRIIITSVEGRNMASVKQLSF